MCYVCYRWTKSVERWRTSTRTCATYAGRTSQSRRSVPPSLHLPPTIRLPTRQYITQKSLFIRTILNAIQIREKVYKMNFIIFLLVKNKQCTCIRSESEPLNSISTSTIEQLSLTFDLSYNQTPNVNTSSSDTSGFST